MCYCSIYRSVEGDYRGVGKKGHANVQMARILQYLECPQYLRKSFFPQHKDLQYAGMYTSSVCLEYLQYFRKSLIKDNIFYSLMKLKDKDNQKY
jgi:hypothetical protein